MRTVAARLGPGALLALGALAVHSLRYRFAYGPSASDTLGSQGHGYLGAVSVVAAVAAALALGLFLRRLARAAREGPVSAVRARGPIVTWTAASLALLAIYVGQETLEGAFAVGHPTGVEGVFGHGGWIALPAALAVGAVIALLLAAARGAIRYAAGRRPQRRLTPRMGSHRPPIVPLLVRSAPLASAAAGRAPPKG